MSKVKFHYYTIAVDPTAQKIDAVLAALKNLPLAKRTRTIYTTEIRLEHIDYNNGKWELCLTKVRSNNWPGVGAANLPSQDLTLSPNQDLTEHTYALIDPQKKLMVIQFTGGGVRASKVGMFLSEHAGFLTAYQCIPVLTKDALARYGKLATFTRIDVGISGATAADMALFNGSAIGSAVTQSVKEGIEDLEVTFKVNAKDKRKSLKSGIIRTLVEKVRKSPNASDLKVYGRPTVDSPVEPIDLLEDVKITLVDDKAIGWTIGKRYDRQRMFDQLHIAINK